MLSEIVLGRMLALVARPKVAPAWTEVYSLHVWSASEDKTHRPDKFGLKVSVATMLSHAKGCQFVTHVKALPMMAIPDGLILPRFTKARQAPAVTRNSHLARDLARESER